MLPIAFDPTLGSVEGSIECTSALSPGLVRACGSGDYGRALAVNRLIGKVYVGGWFDTAGGVAGTVNVAVWDDPEPFTIVDLGTLGTTHAYGMAVNNLNDAAGYSGKGSVPDLDNQEETFGVRLWHGKHAWSILGPSIT